MSLWMPPLNSPMHEPSGDIHVAWAAWFSQVVNMAEPVSGTTANRPTKGLYPGRFYFDESLGANGKPIWVNKTATGWIDSTGAAA